MLKIELREVDSSQKFEENRQSVKSDDIVGHFVDVHSVLRCISIIIAFQCKGREQHCPHECSPTATLEHLARQALAH